MKESERKYIQDCWDYMTCGSAWDRRPKSFMEFLKRDEADLLAYIMDRWLYFQSDPRRRARYNGWYYFKEQDLAENAHIPSGSQYRLLRKLCRLGVIKMERRGVPSKRFIWLNKERIKELNARYAKPLRGQTEYEDPTVPNAEDIQPHEYQAGYGVSS